MKAKILLGALAIAIFMGCQEDEPVPIACFEFTSESIDNDEDPIVNENVKFDNCSQEAISYEWDFGDGKISTTKSPVHKYKEEGEYSVTLTAIGPGGSNTVSQDIEIQMIISIAGRWTGSMTNVLDAAIDNIVCVVEQKNSKLTGTLYITRPGSVITLYCTLKTSSEIDKYNVKIECVEPMRDYNFYFKGNVNKDFNKIEGTWTLNAPGNGVNSGTWSINKN